jgi:hypothetical protein
MRRRARRVTVAAATLGSGVIVGLLVVILSDAVRTHIEAWWLQSTTPTEIIEPNPALQGSVLSVVANDSRLTTLVGILANHSGLPVIVHRVGYDPASLNPPVRMDTTYWGVTSNWALHALRDRGCRILEQRIPRRAYVVIGKERDDERPE